VNAGVYVVWPPVWNAFDPHVAVPALCGYLAEQGVIVRQFDLNVDFFRYLVAQNTIGKVAQSAASPVPERIRNAIAFVQRYYEILHQPLQAGYQQRFSQDAEQHLLSNALAVFNHFHAEIALTTLGIYHNGDAEDSDFIASFASGDTANPFVDFYRETFLRQVAAERPGIVGISVCGSFQLGAAFTLARLVKEVDSRIRVIVGGAFFSTLPRLLLVPKTAANLFRHVDAFVLNEGELPFLRVIRGVLAGSPLQAGPNTMLPGEFELHHDPRCFLPPEQIATPVFASGAVESYFGALPRLPVEVSRGCYWGRCTFCNLPTGSNERYRAIPVDNIIRSIRTLTRRHRTSNVLFSTLAMAPKVLRALAARLISEDLTISWTAWIRPEKTLTREDLELMRKSGCSSLAVTPESFNTRTLERMAKGVAREDLVRIMRDLIDAGLCGSINLIPGFPGETEEELESTLGVCRELGLRGELFPFSLLRNSRVYEEPERFGVVLHESATKDLAVSVPFEYAADALVPPAVELIRRAAQRDPAHVFADDPLAGYTFDFSDSVRNHSSKSGAAALSMSR
jgi:radical SAM superfamily enzyme YgiQ (UPF0313 family)